MKPRHSPRDLRSIRTMRDVWNGRGAKSARCGSGGPRVRLEFSRPGPAREGARDRRAVHPWVFQGRSGAPGGRLIARVVPVVEPQASVRRNPAKERVLLYRLTDALKETIRVDLRGDILILSAQGRSRETGRRFQVSSETHLPGVTAGWRLAATYSAPILEVHVAPPGRGGRA